MEHDTPIAFGNVVWIDADSKSSGHGVINCEDTFGEGCRVCDMKWASVKDDVGVAVNWWDGLLMFSSLKN